MSGAACAVLLIHSFAAEDDNNWKAYDAFVRELGLGPQEKGVVAGPVPMPRAGGVRLYVLWYADKPHTGL